MENKQLNFLLGALEFLHIAIGRDMIGKGKDLSIEQLEMIKEVTARLVTESETYRDN
jgi:hypothetical protein